MASAKLDYLAKSLRWLLPSLFWPPEHFHWRSSPNRFSTGWINSLGSPSLCSCSLAS